MNKQELIRYVKQQLDIDLIELNPIFGKTNDTIYLEIKRDDRFNLLSLLDKKGIRHEEHLNGKYWIYVEVE